MKASSASTTRLSIVYFGSGPLAAQSLAFLHENFDVEAVITKPRAAHHKGAVPVIEYCEAYGLTYHTPTTKAELSELFVGSKFTSQLGVVIDYGIIIQQDVIDAFGLGIVNSHFSLLPEWRGADPITFAILSGQAETGVSLMLINDKMDEGPLLAQAEVTLTPTMHTVQLTQELLEVSNALLSEILPLYQEGAIQPVPQTSSISQTKEPSYSRRLSKADGALDWHKPAVQLEREVRAYIEWPRSYTKLGDVEVIVTAAHVIKRPSQKPGTLEVLRSSGELLIHCAKDCLSIDSLKPAGKKEMTAAEFIRGYGSRLDTE
jgi:methionyl-tRNA formyltransferase